MKKAIRILVCVAVIAAMPGTAAYAYGSGGGGGGTPNVDVDNTLNSAQLQQTSVVGGGDADSSSSSTSSASAEGGASWSNAEGGTGIGMSDSDSTSAVNIETTSNYQTRTAPITTYPPYLPMWNHGGWGTIKAYFPNGPTVNEAVYERTFDPTSEVDMQEVRGVLRSLSHTGPLSTIGGLLNSVCVLFGAPDNYHHGRGLEISSSVTRTRRPAGKPLLVFIDSNVDPSLLKQEGYAYVGTVSLEAHPNRNWDHAYKAAVAEALLWDVDILLVTGGMKGVTVGGNRSLPGVGVGYSQANYSLSLIGGNSKGITEGKGKAVMSATAYRFCPALIQHRRIPRDLYDRIRMRPKGTPAVGKATRGLAPAGQPTGTPGISVSQEMLDMAGFQDQQQVQNLAVK